MPRYKVVYRIETEEGPVRRFVEAGTETDARLQIERDGGHVIAVLDASATGFGRFLKWLRNLLYGKLSLRFWVNDGERALFCEVLKTLSSTGVPLPQALQLTIDETPNAWLRSCLEIVLARLRQGEEFADAMETNKRCRRAFPPLMRETIRTGAAAGRLDESLERLADMYRRASETRRQTMTAMIYPGLTMAVFIVVCIVIAIKVPEALEMAAGGEDKLDEMARDFPVAIRILLYLEKNRAALFAPPGVIAGIAVLWSVGKKFSRTRLVLTKAERRIPMIGGILYEFAIVRFLQLLAANHDSGIQIVESLRLIRNSVSDALIEVALMRMRGRILTSGLDLAQAMHDEKVFPGLVRQMVTAGVESGRIGETIAPIVRYYEERAKAMLQRTVDLLPVLLILLLGGIIGPVVYGIYMTIIKITLKMGATLG